MNDKGKILMTELLNVKYFYEELIKSLDIAKTMLMPPQRLINMNILMFQVFFIILIDYNFYLNFSNDQVASFIVLTGVYQIHNSHVPNLSKIFKKIFQELAVTFDYSSYGCLKIVNHSDLFKRKNDKKIFTIGKLLILNGGCI